MGHALCPHSTFKIWIYFAQAFQPVVASTMAVLALFIRALIFATTLGLCTAEKGCFEEYGTGINPQHCREAMKNFDALVNFASHGGSVKDDQWFSRTPALVGTFRHLPKAFVFGTCSIGIDLADHPHDGPPPDGTGVRSSWAAFGRELSSLVNTCVQNRGLGGLVTYSDFEFVIVNPQAGISHGTCLTPHKPPGMSLSRCIERQIVAKESLHHSGPQTAARPALPGTHGAQQPPSQPQIPAPRGAQRPPLFDAQVQGVARLAAARLLVGQFHPYQGEQVTNSFLQQQAQRPSQQQAYEAQQRAQDLAQQQSDRSAQRQAVSGQQPRPPMGKQQPPASSQASQAFNIAPLRLGQQPPEAWMVNRLFQILHPPQQPQQAAQGPGPAQGPTAAQSPGRSPSPGSPSGSAATSGTRSERRNSGPHSPELWDT